MLENLVKLTAKRKYFSGLNTVFLISLLSQVLLSLQLVVLSQIKWDLHQIFCLSMVDETDVGFIPSLSEIDMDGEMVKCWISLCLVGQLKQINDQLLFTLKS
jgi:hypothetical protein